MFWNKKNDTRTTALTSTEYELCLKRIAEVYTAFQTIKGDIENIKTDMLSLRGKLNKKLGLVQQEEEKKTETINNNEFVPFG